MTSYITLLSKIEQFCNAHLQIKKYGGEFREQMPNFSTKDEKYPIVFIEPLSDLEDLNTNQFSINVYCVDIIQKDRANLNTILSDCQLILKDMYVYYTNDMDAQLDVVGTASMSPLNNYDLDYVAGWVMGITFEVSTYGPCEIPMEPITPTPVECQDGSVENTDQTYTATVASGGLLVLPDVNLVVKDQDGNILSDEIYPSVQDEQIIVTLPTCEDASYKFTDSAGTTLYEGTIPSGGYVEGSINDSFVSNSNDTYTADVLAEGSLELPDVTFSINNSVGTQVLSTTVPSVTNQTLVAPDGAVHIKHEADGTIAVVSTPSGVQTDYIIQNNDITVNNANPFVLHAEEPLDIRLKNQSNATITPSSVSYNGNQHYVDVTINTASFVPVGASLIKSGQTTSYATGDDGNIQAGRATSFTALASNNPFGNTNRFTSELGTQTYTNNIVIDWSTYNNSTVLGYYRLVYSDNISWTNAIILANAKVIGGFSSWRMCNIREMQNIFNYGIASSTVLNYAPFSITTNQNVWNSTTNPLTTTSAYYTTISSAETSFAAKTTNGPRYMVCRTFTVTGTTLS